MTPVMTVMRCVRVLMDGGGLVRLMYGLEVVMTPGGVSGSPVAVGWWAGLMKTVMMEPVGGAREEAGRRGGDGW